MTILHVAMGMPEFDRACVDLGHQVIRLPWPSMSYHDRNKWLLRHCTERRVDVVFMQLQNPNVIDPSTLKAVRDTGAMVINWTGDVRDPIPHHYIDMAPHVDITAFTNLPDVVAMQEMGYDARFLQIGYDPLIYNTDNRYTNPRRVVFVGNDYRGLFPLSHARREKVDALHKVFRNEFASYGKGFGRGLHNGQDAEVYKEALIAINLDHFNRTGFYSDRYIRSRACGAYTINGTAMTTEALIEEVRMALDKPALTEEHGRQQSLYCINHERWHSRIQTIEEWHATWS